MSRRMRSSNEDFEYDSDEHEDQRGPRRFRKEDKEQEKKKKWDRESLYDRDHDYDERR
jgi:hypothetical protein